MDRENRNWIFVIKRWGHRNEGGKTGRKNCGEGRCFFVWLNTLLLFFFVLLTHFFHIAITYFSLWFHSPRYRQRRRVKLTPRREIIENTFDYIFCLFYILTRENFTKKKHCNGSTFHLVRSVLSFFFIFCVCLWSLTWFEWRRQPTRRQSQDSRRNYLV